MSLIVQLLCPFGYGNTFSSSICISLLFGVGLLVSIGVSFYVRGTRKVRNKKTIVVRTSLIFNLSRRHVLVLKIIGGITLLGACGFNIAMNFPNNEILIGVSIVVCSIGVAILPLSNELIVETTYPAGEATSTAIGIWLAGPVSGALIASSALIPYGDQDDYPYGTCREGELQDLSWFVTMMNGIFLVYYIFFAYFYRKADQVLFKRSL